jgi:hypothetical protein
MRVDDSGLTWLGPGVHRKSSGEEGFVVVSELEPELPLDLAEFRVRETGVDRADGSESQATHGLLAEPPAGVTELINPCRHEAGLYLATCRASTKP